MTLDDLDTEYSRLILGPMARTTELIQSLQAAISRRDWHATDEAASALRDYFEMERRAARKAARA